MSFADDTAVANLALTHLGRRRFTNGDGSPEETVAELYYAAARQATLRAVDWQFAGKRKALTVSATNDPPSDWSYAYTYPADCLKVRHLQNAVRRPNAHYPYRIEVIDTATPSSPEKAILCDVADAIAVYTYNHTDPTAWPADFGIALSYHLASLMAMTLTGKTAVRDAMWNAYIQTLDLAAALDGNEQVLDVQPEGFLIASRA